MKTKILFIVEALTWSQVVRCLVLARGLDPHKYEVHFASASFDERMFAGTSFKRWPIYSIPSEPAVEWATSTVDTQRVPYTKGILEKYIAEELALYEAIDPDFVVADMRFFSTSVSAPAFGVPCANLINAFYTYWIRRGSYRGFPLPEIRQLQWVNRTILEKYFIPLAMPIGLRYMPLVRTVNTLRKQHGLPKIRDLFHQMTWGDYVLFPDDPLLVPLAYQAPHETFLGPVLWSPQIPLPEYWDELGRDRPMIYATLGSSGTVSAVPTVLEALGGMDVDVVFSTAVRYTPKDPPPNVHVVEMIQGDLAARKASVVVCHGGAGPGYQALAEGTPIVAVSASGDQFLSAIAMRDAGAGLFLRASTITPAKIRTAVDCIVRDERFTQAAQRVAASFARLDPHARFQAVIDKVTANVGAAT